MPIRFSWALKNTLQKGGGLRLGGGGRQTAGPRRGQRSMTGLSHLLQGQSPAAAGPDASGFGCQGPSWGPWMWPAGHCHPLVVSYEKAASPTSHGARDAPALSSRSYLPPPAFPHFLPSFLSFSAQPIALLPDGQSLHLSALG